MAMVAKPDVIEAAENLKHRGISSDNRVMLTIEPDGEWIPGLCEWRAKVVGACLSDVDIDRLIKQAQKEVESELGQNWTVDYG